MTRPKTRTPLTPAGQARLEEFERRRILRDFKRRARDARTDPKRYRLTPAALAWLERHDALRRATINTDWRAKNQQALAQLRALNNALLAAGLHRPPNASKP